MKSAAVLLLMLLSSVGPSSAANQCAVQAQPTLSLAPLTFIRVKVTIEREPRRREARLSLVSIEGVERSSELQTDVRVQWIEWKNIALDPGEYDVVLQVSNGCIARQRIEVAGDR